MKISQGHLNKIFLNMKNYSYYEEIIDEFTSHKARKSKFSKFKINTLIITYKYKLYTRKNY
jgi:hypothetical protein